MNCPHCNTEVPKNFSYCPSCGKKVKTISMPSFVPPLKREDPKPEPAAADDVHKETIDKQPERRKKPTVQKRKPSREKRSTPRKKSGKEISILVPGIIQFVLAILLFLSKPDDDLILGISVFSFFILLYAILRGKKSNPFPILFNILLIWVCIILGGLIAMGVMFWVEDGDLDYFFPAIIAFVQFFVLYRMFYKRPRTD